MSSDLYFKRSSGFQKQVFSPQEYAYFPRPMLICDSMTSLYAYDPCLKNCLGIFHAELEGGKMEVSFHYWAYDQWTRNALNCERSKSYCTINPLMCLFLQKHILLYSSVSRPWILALSRGSSFQVIIYLNLEVLGNQGTKIWKIQVKLNSN